MTHAWFGVLAGVLALGYALITMMSVLKESMGTPKMKEISEAIQEGAMAYLNKQYKALIPFTGIIFVVLFFVAGAPMSISFLVGAVCSGIAGYIGMNSTTKSNARTTEAARSNGLGKALKISFRAGAVMGLSVAGLGLLGVSSLFLIFQDADVINSFAFGASVIAFFARVGGGIFTKAADVGADLVGKVEAGIPEDDPRNPATIADNVGDNVGDTAGMGADLFESYGATTIAAMILGNSLFGLSGALFPLLVGTIGIIASIIGTFCVRTSENGNPQTALNIGLWTTNILTAVCVFFLSGYIFEAPLSYGITIAIVIGLIVNILIGGITEYYTSGGKRPVNNIIRASETGPATNAIQGLAVGLESAFVPMLVFAAAIFGAYTAAGMAGAEYAIFGIAMAAMGMLSTAGIVVAMDSFGPVADNAGGIAEMADLPPEVREITDKLDSVGNTTAAIAKGFAIGSAALTALALFQAFVDSAAKNANLQASGALDYVDGAYKLIINLNDPLVLIGLFIGGAVPFLVAAFTMKAVGDAAGGMVEEVRRQFREIPGIMEGTGKPDYARCVSIATGAAISKMIPPGIVAVACPLIVGFGLGVKAMAGFLCGLTVTGVLLALFLSNAGGAWDNAKKWIEANGGKKTADGQPNPAHQAAVIGDTIGDPCKDTAGPAMNPLIKVAGTIALIIVPFLMF
ncbi:MAG: sodium-translocating pyrophosphatase [Eubacteriales bacterium]|nr:sodium-translocating pyrophosphatase [Eubacteriales bacterium]MDD4390359.1 sodium-translocating pyrophosphatase [Eubacteriales bacterium]